MSDNSRPDGPSQQAWASAYWLARDLLVKERLAEVGPNGLLRPLRERAVAEMAEKTA